MRAANCVQNWLCIDCGQKWRIEYALQVLKVFVVIILNFNLDFNIVVIVIVIVVIVVCLIDHLELQVFAFQKLKA
jgi:hypothetical protein